MCNNPKRVYRSDDGGMTCIATDYAQLPDGKLVRSPRTPATPKGFVSAASVGGCPIFTSQQMTPGYVGAMQPIRPYETQNGLIENGRSESQDGAAGIARTYTIGLQNATANPVVALIGDANKVYELQRNIAALPAPGVSGFNVSGTFGANALNQFKLMSGNNPARLHRMRVSVSNADVFGTATIIQARGQWDGSIQDVDMALNTWVNPGDFQALIAEKNDFRAIVDGFQVFAVTVPAGRTITITFELRSVADIYQMGLV